MVFGKPVIASRIGALPEIVINGKNGILFKPEDPASLSGAIIKLLKNQNLINSVGKYNQDYIQKFDWKTSSINTAKIYEELIRK